LGGQSICAKLKEAIDKGIRVRVVYVGLSSAELHSERVKARVKNGGHDIPKEKIEERYISSRLNVIDLINQGVDEMVVWDNSSGLENGKPKAKKTFHFNKQGWILPPDKSCPVWAKSLASAAIKKLLD
jgi:predicted ABC-type ATPase